MSLVRHFQCTRCLETVRCSSPGPMPPRSPTEDRCPDPKAPGGYWYCSYVEVFHLTETELRGLTVDLMAHVGKHGFRRFDLEQFLSASALCSSNRG